MNGRYKLKWLCEALLVSRSGYYDWQRRRQSPGPRERESRALRQRIREEFIRSRQTYGTPRLTCGLQGAASCNRVARLMCEERLYARQRSKYRVATNDSRHGDPIAPNWLQQLVPPRRDQVWVTDAACVLTGQGRLYIVALLDVYTRRIVGWSMGETLDTPLTIKALRMAIQQRRPRPGLIVHPTAAQFAAAAYRQVLAQSLRAFHEPKRKLLRQRLHRVVLEQPQIRSRLSSPLRHAR
jgi:putative transposase